MDNKDKYRNFVAYINNLMSMESIILIYDANNIRFDKCELYSDFVQSLLALVFNTYMGDEVTTLEERTNHFKWCWDKNLCDFANEGIIFESLKLYEYFLEYMLEVFYSVEKSTTDYSDNISSTLWFDIFDYNKSKTRSDMDTMVDLYKIFETSLNRT